MLNTQPMKLIKKLAEIKTLVMMSKQEILVFMHRKKLSMINGF
jgi:hypothetical protein